MFKFTIIESQQHNFKNQPVDLIAKKLKLLQGKEGSLKSQNNIIFIIAEGFEKGIIGGACVLKKELKNIQEDIRELIRPMDIYHDYVWECSSVYLETSPKYPAPGTAEAEHLSQSFYKELYEGLVLFGTKKGVGFVTMRLIADAYASTKEFGLWPYVVELRPESSPDGLFHGVLPLTGSEYEAYQKEWETLGKNIRKNQ